MLFSNGQLLWSRDVASSTGISLDAEMLYVTDIAGDVWALSRRGGGTMWKQSALHQRALSAPVQQGNYIVVGDYEGYLHWLSKEDGHLAGRTRIRQWQAYFPVEDENEAFTAFYPEDRRVLMAPAVEGVYVYGLDIRGVLDAFELRPVAAEAK
jgi:outer membrane protein assembly factor BamB